MKPKFCHSDVPNTTDEVPMRERAAEACGFHQGQTLTDSLAELERNERRQFRSRLAGQHRSTNRYVAVPGDFETVRPPVFRSISCVSARHDESADGGLDGR